MAKIITAATPLADRRLFDLDAFYLRGRNISAKPATGQVLIKVSHDDGATYDAVETLTGNPQAFTLSTYGLRMEIECTADARVTIAE